MSFIYTIILFYFYYENIVKKIKLNNLSQDDSLIIIEQSYKSINK